MGWHIPTDFEWTTLSTCLGGDAVAGGLLKEIGTTHWLTPNTGATNSSGFTGLPGGSRDVDGSFNTFGGFGYWWSSTEFSAPSAWYRNLNYNNSSISKAPGLEQVGCYVRCLRD